MPYILYIQTDYTHYRQQVMLFCSNREPQYQDKSKFQQASNKGNDKPLTIPFSKYFLWAPKKHTAQHSHYKEDMSENQDCVYQEKAIVV